MNESIVQYRPDGWQGRRISNSFTPKILPPPPRGAKGIYYVIYLSDGSVILTPECQNTTTKQIQKENSASGEKENMSKETNTLSENEVEVEDVYSDNNLTAYAADVQRMTLNTSGMENQFGNQFGDDKNKELFNPNCNNSKVLEELRNNSRYESALGGNKENKIEKQSRYESALGRNKQIKIEKQSRYESALGGNKQNKIEKQEANIATVKTKIENDADCKKLKNNSENENKANCEKLKTNNNNKIDDNTYLVNTSVETMYSESYLEDLEKGFLFQNDNVSELDEGNGSLENTFNHLNMYDDDQGSNRLLYIGIKPKEAQENKNKNKIIETLKRKSRSSGLLCKYEYEKLFTIITKLEESSIQRIQHFVRRYLLRKNSAITIQNFLRTLACCRAVLNFSRYNCDYSRRSHTTYIPDDEATKEEYLQIQQDNESNEMLKFEKDNKEWCDMMKTNIQKGNEENVKRQNKVNKLRMKGNCYYKAKEYWKALDLYMEALQRNKFDIILLTNISMCYSKLEKIDEAIEFCNRANYVSDKNHTKALYHQALMYIKKKCYSIALQDSNTCILLEPSNKDVLNRREWLLREIADDYLEQRINRIIHMNKITPQNKINEEEICSSIIITKCNQENFTSSYTEWNGKLCSKKHDCSQSLRGETQDIDDIELLSLCRKVHNIMKQIIEEIDIGSNIEQDERISKEKEHLLLEGFVQLINILETNHPLTRTYFRMRGFLLEVCNIFRNAKEEYIILRNFLYKVINASIKEERRSKQLVAKNCIIEAPTISISQKTNKDCMTKILLKISAMKILTIALNDSDKNDEAYSMIFTRLNELIPSIYILLSLLCYKEVTVPINEREHALNAYSAFLSSLLNLCGNSNSFWEKFSSCYDNQNTIANIVQALIKFKNYTGYRVIRSNLVDILVNFSTIEEIRPFFGDPFQIVSCNERKFSCILILLTLAKSYNSENERCRLSALVAMINSTVKTKQIENFWKEEIVKMVLCKCKAIPMLINLCISNHYSLSIKIHSSNLLGHYISIPEGVKEFMKHGNSLISLTSIFTDIVLDEDWSSSDSKSDDNSKMNGDLTRNLIQIIASMDPGPVLIDTYSKALIQVLPKPKLDFKKQVITQSVIQALPSPSSLPSSLPSSIPSSNRTPSTSGARRSYAPPRKTLSDANSNVKVILAIFQSNKMSPKGLNNFIQDNCKIIFESPKLSTAHFFKNTYPFFDVIYQTFHQFMSLLEGEIIKNTASILSFLAGETDNKNDSSFNKIKDCFISCQIYQLSSYVSMIDSFQRIFKLNTTFKVNNPLVSIDFCSTILIHLSLHTFDDAPRNKNNLYRSTNFIQRTSTSSYHSCRSPSFPEISIIVEVESKNRLSSESYTNTKLFIFRMRNSLKETSFNYSKSVSPLSSHEEQVLTIHLSLELSSIMLYVAPCNTINSIKSSTTNLQQHEPISIFEKIHINTVINSFNIVHFPKIKLFNIPTDITSCEDSPLCNEPNNASNVYHSFTENTVTSPSEDLNKIASLFQSFNSSFENIQDDLSISYFGNEATPKVASNSILDTHENTSFISTTSLFETISTPRLVDNHKNSPLCSFEGKTTVLLQSSMQVTYFSRKIFIDHQSTSFIVTNSTILNHSKTIQNSFRSKGLYNIEKPITKYTMIFKIIASVASTIFDISSINHILYCYKQLSTTSNLRSDLSKLHQRHDYTNTMTPLVIGLQPLSTLQVREKGNSKPIVEGILRKVLQGM